MNLVVAGLAVVLVTLATQLHVDAGLTGAGLVSLITLGELFTGIVNAYTGLETSLGGMARLKSFQDSTEQERQPEIESRLTPGREWPTTGKVEIKGVFASYGDSTQGELVLKDINLTIQAREKVALCGRTGR